MLLHLNKLRIFFSLSLSLSLYHSVSLSLYLSLSLSLSFSPFHWVAGHLFVPVASWCHCLLSSRQLGPASLVIATWWSLVVGIPEVTNSVTLLYMKFGIRNPEFGICYSFSNHGNYLVFVSEYLFSYSSTSKLRLVRLPTDVVGKVRCSAFHTYRYVIKSFKSFYASWILDCTRMRVAQYHLTLIKEINTNK